MSKDLKVSEEEAERIRDAERQAFQRQADPTAAQLRDANKYIEVLKSQNQHLFNHWEAAQNRLAEIELKLISMTGSEQSIDDNLQQLAELRAENVSLWNKVELLSIKPNVQG